MPIGMTMEEIKSSYVTRHSSVLHVLQFFANAHLPPELQEFTREIQMLAFIMVDELDDSLELTHGLRQLLEAKDSFVRAYLISKN